MFDAVLRGHNFSLICHFAVNINYNNGDDGALLIFVHGTMLCCLWTHRPYVCIAVCVLKLEVVLVFDAVYGRNAILIIYALPWS